MADIMNILQSNYTTVGKTVPNKTPYVAVDPKLYQGTWSGTYPDRKTFKLTVSDVSGFRAQVKYHFERGSALEEGVNIARWQQPRRRMLGQVAPFPRAAQMVDDDGLDAAAHQCRLQIRADEAGATGDQDHGARYTGRGESAERGWRQ